jgi:hypothetical protein
MLSLALAGGITSGATAVPRGKCRGRSICGVDYRCPPPPQNPEATARCCTPQECSCNGECCPGRCFWEGDPKAPTREFCCRKPYGVMCEDPAGNVVCCPYGDENPCACAGNSGIAGSYRRP